MVVTSTTAAVAEAADFLDDSTVAAVCWVGEIILGDASVMWVALEPSCGSREVGRLAVDDANDDGDAAIVVVAVAAVAAIVVDEVVGSFSVVVADVATVCGAVTFVAVVVAATEEDDDECKVAFAIGLDAVVVVVIAEAFLPPAAAIVVVFLTFAESPFDDAGTADAVISSNARQTLHWIARILSVDIMESSRFRYFYVQDVFLQGVFTLYKRRFLP